MRGTIFGRLHIVIRNMREVCLAVLSVSALGAQGTPRTSPETVAVRAARLVDPRSATTVTNPVIVIEGDRVKAVGPGLAIPAGARVIDLGNATLLPGLIDCHTHITMQPSNYYEDMFRRSPIDYAIIAPIYARRTLEAGFTTVRDLGASEYVDLALKRAIDQGDVPGPRMIAAGLAITSTGSMMSAT